MLKRVVIQHTKELRKIKRKRETVLVLHQILVDHNIKAIDLSEIKLLSSSIYFHDALNPYDAKAP